MTKLKYDEDSDFPPNIQRIFNYDNETVFSYLVQTQQTEIEWLPKDWHWIVDVPDKEMSRSPSQTISCNRQTV